MNLDIDDIAGHDFAVTRYVPMALPDGDGLLVSGTSHRQDMLQRIAASRGDAWGALSCRHGGPPSIRLGAQLIPDPGNQHDRYAVSVRIGGNLIGWITRKQSSEWQPMLIDMIEHGRVPVADGRLFRFDDTDELGACLHVPMPTGTRQMWWAKRSDLQRS